MANAAGVAVGSQGAEARIGAGAAVVTVAVVGEQAGRFAKRLVDARGGREAVGWRARAAVGAVGRECALGACGSRAAIFANAVATKQATIGTEHRKLVGRAATPAIVAIGAEPANAEARSSGAIFADSVARRGAGVGALLVRCLLVAACAAVGAIGALGAGCPRAGCPSAVFAGAIAGGRAAVVAYTAGFGRHAGSAVLTIGAQGAYCGHRVGRAIFAGPVSRRGAFIAAEHARGPRIISASRG